MAEPTEHDWQIIAAMVQAALAAAERPLERGHSPEDDGEAA